MTKSLRNRRVYFPPSSPLQSWISLPWCLKGLWHAFVHVRRLDFWRSGELFSRLAFDEEIFFHRPWEARESYYISVQGLFGPFWKFYTYILYVCASIVQKIRSHWGEVHEAILFVVSVPTSGSNGRLMWSFGFHLCLLSSPVNDLPFPDSF